MSNAKCLTDKVEFPANGNAKRAVWLHPAWLAFLRFCEELRYGEIGRLSIQDGLPVLAEVTTRKVKFGR